MASFSARAINRRHVRSISMPARSYPLPLALEEKLNQLRTTWENSSFPSSSLSAKTISDDLAGLGRLYDCLMGLLILPLTQQVLVRHRHEKRVDDLLDGSVKLMDACGIARESLLFLKVHVQDLQSGLRRRREGCAALKSMLDSYIISRKKAMKDIKKCLRMLKQMDNRCGVYPTMDCDLHLSMAIRASFEVRAVTISILSSILSYMSMSKSRSRATRWSLVSKAMSMGKVASEGKDEDSSEVENADRSLYAFYEDLSTKDIDLIRIHDLQTKLQLLEDGIVGLESGLEFIYSHLIKTRLSLLNILNL